MWDEAARRELQNIENRLHVLAVRDVRELERQVKHQRDELSRVKDNLVLATTLLTGIILVLSVYVTILRIAP